MREGTKIRIRDERRTKWTPFSESILVTWYRRNRDRWNRELKELSFCFVVSRPHDHNGL